MIGEHPVLLKHWIPGHVTARLADDRLRDAGDLLARLHVLPSAEVPDLPVGTRRLSAAHLEAIDEFPDQRFADWLRSGLAKVRAQEDRLTDGPVICHGDVFADNLIVRPDETLAVIDWETVSLDGPLLDLGMTLLGLANVDGRLDKKRADLIVSGYADRRSLTREQYATLPWEVEHAALIIASTATTGTMSAFPIPPRAASTPKWSASLTLSGTWTGREERPSADRKIRHREHTDDHGATRAAHRQWKTFACVGSAAGVAAPGYPSLPQQCDQRRQSLPSLTSEHGCGDSVRPGHAAASGHPGPGGPQHPVAGHLLDQP
ncbi:hypothetical protein GCM10009727_73230 [Actinomadura napierensis]|uniref:Aminoglycoside phosphotransferase domain-containing protein n=1 Tax=Actinomadura napierensis TaxID=267854 RepID=A0ABN3ACY7_9ACTN